MKERSTTSIERHFLISNVYKRSRRYFDIVRLNQIEHQQEMQRRSPKTSKDTIDTRFTQNFVCSNSLLNDKVNNDIGLFQSRKVLNDEADEVQTTATSTTRKPRTIDMRKMLARSDLQREKPKHRNEERFNNFSFSQHKPRTSMDFNNYLDREHPKTHRYDNPEPEFSQESRVGKIYEKMLFDQSHGRCFVDLQKYDRRITKQQIDESPIYELSKIRRGQSLTKKNTTHLAEFYRGHGRMEPSQLDNRVLKDNQYQWRRIGEERERARDFSVEKRKEDQVLDRLNRILARKRLPDEKGEMCDEKFFRRNSKI